MRLSPPRLLRNYSGHCYYKYDQDDYYKGVIDAKTSFLAILAKVVDCKIGASVGIAERAAGNG